MARKPATPNPDIDAAIHTMMKRIKGKEPPPDDIVVKILNTAIAWEKAKNQIADNAGGFDPGSFDEDPEDSIL